MPVWRTVELKIGRFQCYIDKKRGSDRNNKEKHKGFVLISSVIIKVDDLAFMFFRYSGFRCLVFDIVVFGFLIYV